MKRTKFFSLMLASVMILNFFSCTVEASETKVDENIIKLNREQILSAKAEDYPEDAVLLWDGLLHSKKDVYDGKIPVSKLNDQVYCSMNLPSESNWEFMHKSWRDNGHFYDDAKGENCVKILSIGALYAAEDEQLPENFSVYLSNIKLFAYSKTQKCWLVLDNQQYTRGLRLYDSMWRNNQSVNIDDRITYEEDYVKVDLTAEDLSEHVLHFWGYPSYYLKDDFIYYASAFTFWVDEAAAGKITATNGIDTKDSSGVTATQLFSSRGYAGATYPKVVWGHTIPNEEYDKCKGSVLNHLYDFLGGKTMNEFLGIPEPSEEETPTPGTEEQNTGSENSNPTPTNADTTTSANTSGAGNTQTVSTNTTVSTTTSTTTNNTANTTANTTTNAAANTTTTPESAKADIKPVKLKKISLNKKKNIVKIKWDKVSDVSGYEIQISTDKKFKKNVSIYNAKANKNNKKFKISGTGKKCYVRIRAYVKDGNNITNSSWSKKKQIKF